MRQLISLWLLFTSITSFSQSFTQLGSDFPDVIEGEVFTNSLGTPFFAYLSNGKLKVQSFIGGVWSDVDNTVPVLDSVVNDFDVEMNYATDEIFISYTKDNGMYYRRYSLSWSGAQFISGTCANQNNNGVKISIDNYNNQVFLVFDKSNISTIEHGWIKIDMQTLNYDTIPTPPDYYHVNGFLGSGDFRFNNQNQTLYFSSSSNSTAYPIIQQFDGTTWSDVASPVASTFNSYSLIAFDTVLAPVKDILVATKYNTASPSFDIRGYDPVSLNSGYLHPYTTQTDQVTLKSLEVNPVNNYIAFTYLDHGVFPNESVLKYYNAGAWHIIPTGIPTSQINDMHFANDGDLFLAINRGPNPYMGDYGVYRSDLFYTSVEEYSTQKISIYPNPAASMISIESNTSIDSYEIYSIDGSLVLSGSLNGTSNQLDVGELSKGVYILKCQGNEVQLSKQFVKE
jgi:hypothetical protein